MRQCGSLLPCFIVRYVLGVVLDRERHGFVTIPEPCARPTGALRYHRHWLGSRSHSLYRLVMLRRSPVGLPQVLTQCCSILMTRLRRHCRISGAAGHTSQPCLRDNPVCR
jgi:hypothetical protein